MSRHLGLFNLRILIVCLFTLCSLAAFGQAQVTPATKPDPVGLLNEVAQNYARAKTYHIEAIEETVRINPQYYNWQKTYLTAIQGTENRFRFQIKTGIGLRSWLQVSDGKAQWLYGEHSNRYMEQPASQGEPTIMSRVFGFGGELEQAVWMIHNLESLAAEHNSTAFLQDETLTMGGHDYSCYVVHDSQPKEDTLSERLHNYERTFWIDKQSKVIRKIVSTGDEYVFGDDIHSHPAYTLATTTIYPVVELKASDSDTIFSFTPPADAKKVTTFNPPGLRPPLKPANTTTLMDQPAPDVQFVAKNGKTISLASYRDKPVLLDFWATWCAPCVESMPKLAQLERQLRGKNVAIISVDEDNDAETARQYFIRHQYVWTDYHDNNGTIQKAFHAKAIPLIVLIGPHGKILFYENTWNGPALRSAIAKLGPEYASFKPQ